jgi:hypothetical protein
MKVHVRYPLYRFAWQAGDIKVIDVVVFRIKQIEDIDLRPEIFILIASLQVDQGGCLGTHTVILNERPWVEIAGAETAEQAIG